MDYIRMDRSINLGSIIAEGGHMSSIINEYEEFLRYEDTYLRFPDSEFGNIWKILVKYRVPLIERLKIFELWKEDIKKLSKERE